tara:strand:- start:219 stop:662 length:444 start_codon:yes stop_codon:yes gene_type:complete
LFESSNTLILAIEEQITSVIGSEDPTKTFPSVTLGRVDSEKRIKLYAHLLGIFFDEAESLEQLIFESDLGGMSLIKINEVITERIAEIPEDDIPLIAGIWVESLDFDEELDQDEGNAEVLEEILFKLIHVCSLAKQERALSIFVYSK